MLKAGDKVKVIKCCNRRHRNNPVDHRRIYTIKSIKKDATWSGGYKIMLKEIKDKNYGFSIPLLKKVEVSKKPIC